MTIDERESLVREVLSLARANIGPRPGEEPGDLEDAVLALAFETLGSSYRPRRVEELLLRRYAEEVANDPEMSPRGKAAVKALDLLMRYQRGDGEELLLEAHREAASLRV